MSTQYRNNHDRHEAYSARIQCHSKKANQLRRNSAKAATHTDGKIQAYCCENDVDLDRNKWIDHLIRHTREYTHHCKQMLSHLYIHIG